MPVFPVTAGEFFQEQLAHCLFSLNHFQPPTLFRLNPQTQFGLLLEQRYSWVFSFLTEHWYFMAGRCILQCLGTTFFFFFGVWTDRKALLPRLLQRCHCPKQPELVCLGTSLKLSFRLVYWCSVGQASSTAKPGVNAEGWNGTWKPRYIHIDSSSEVRFQQSPSSTLLGPRELISFVCISFFPIIED